MVALTLVLILGAELAAPVTGAVVYGGQARLTRTSEVTLSGRERLELPLLPREVDPDSVRVEVLGGELESVDVTRLGALSLRVEEAKGVVAALERLDDDLALAAAEDEALETAAGLGDEAPVIPDDEEALTKVDPERWRQTLAFLHGWRERLDQRRTAVAARIDLLRGQRAPLAEKAAALAEGDERRVRLVVHVAGHGRATVRTSYLLAGPSWTPRYEVRLDSVHDAVDVSLAALAEQDTGEDWQQAALTFSTALPLISTAAPELPRWTIGERDRFIPVTGAGPESVESATASAAGPPPELAALRARLEALSTAPSKPPAEAAQKTGQTLVKELLEKTEVHTGGYGADRPQQSFTQDGFDIPHDGNGAMVGYVFDQTGNPIKGVRLSVSSPTLVGGARVAYTNDEGWFKYSRLPAGTYEARASAPKLKTVIQKDIRVGVQPAEVNLVMEFVEQTVEEVMVVEKAPLVNTTSSSVTETFESEFVSVASPSAPSPARPRQTISLAPPEGRRRPRLAPGPLAALAGGHDLSFPAVAPETLVSGALPQRVPLGTWRWPVAVRRQLFPALRPDAYLVANLRSPAPEPLPAGEVALFLDGQPVGKANLTVVLPGQPFTLPLGIDRAVRARRQVELQSHEEGLISKEDVNRYAVTIEVANPHRQGVALDVFDQLPQAGDDSVQVKLESSEPPVKVDQQQGLLTWHTGLAAGATLKLRFVYTLRRPKGNRLHQ